MLTSSTNFEHAERVASRAPPPRLDASELLAVWDRLAPDNVLARENGSPSPSPVTLDVAPLVDVSVSGARVHVRIRQPIASS